MLILMSHVRLSMSKKFAENKFKYRHAHSGLKSAEENNKQHIFVEFFPNGYEYTLPTKYINIVSFFSFVVYCVKDY